jgi:hypothetical protein
MGGGEGREEEKEEEGEEEDRETGGAKGFLVLGWEGGGGEHDRR